MTRSDMYRHAAVAGCAILINLAILAVILEFSARFPLVFLKVWVDLSTQERAVAFLAYFTSVLIAAYGMRRVKARSRRTGRSAAQA